MPQGTDDDGHTQQNTTRDKPHHTLALQFSHNIFSHYTRDLEATLPLPPRL
jgi:hypothetical protein